MWILFIIIPVFIIIDLFLLKIYFYFIFQDKEDFYNSVKYNFTPDIFSLFRGEYFKDKFAEFKLGIFMFLCFITVIMEFFLVSRIVEIIKRL